MFPPRLPDFKCPKFETPFVTVYSSQVLKKNNLSFNLTTVQNENIIICPFLAAIVLAFYTIETVVQSLRRLSGLGIIKRPGTDASPSHSDPPTSTLHLPVAIIIPRWSEIP